MVKDSESALYKELKNIKKLESDLKDLKDKLAEIKLEQDKNLLKTKRDIAGLTLLLFGNYFYSKVERHPINAQFIADITNTSSKISTSDEPLALVNEFQDKYNKILEKLGIISHLTYF